MLQVQKKLQVQVQVQVQVKFKVQLHLRRKKVLPHQIRPKLKKYFRRKSKTLLCIGDCLMILT